MPENTLLSVVRLPGRLTTNQVAELLGFALHDIPVLVRANLLKPLGNPVANATKYFASCEIQELATNHKWLHKATNEIYGHWSQQNQSRRSSVTLCASERNPALN
jgi:hypothetical protein